MNETGKSEQVFTARRQFSAKNHPNTTVLRFKNKTMAKRICGWIRFELGVNPASVGCVSEDQNPFKYKKHVVFEDALSNGFYHGLVATRGPTSKDEAVKTMAACRKNAPTANDMKNNAKQTAKAGTVPNTPDPDPSDDYSVSGWTYAPEPADAIETPDPDAFNSYAIKNWTEKPKPASVIETPHPVLPSTLRTAATAASVLLQIFDQSHITRAELSEALNRLNQRLMDLVHVSEFYDLSPEQCQKVQTAIYEARKERRLVKDELIGYDAMDELDEECIAALTRISTLPKRLSSRKYSLRELTAQELAELLETN